MKRFESALTALSIVFMSVALMIISYIIATWVNPTVQSASFFDLVATSIVNVFIAHYISGRVVRRFESRQHSLAFLVDILKKMDELCTKLADLKINDLIEDKNVSLKYISFAKILAGYADASSKQAARCSKNKDAIIACAEMIAITEVHYRHALKLRSLVNNNDVNGVKAEYEKIQAFVLTVQAYIPQIMAAIYH